jgi:triphosphatase
MSELELKFGLSEASLASLRTALRAQGARRTRLRAHYFDTADGLLARHLIALRLRLEGRHWVQTLKAADAGTVHRLEHEVRVPGSAAVLPALDLHLHDGSEAGAALQAALQSEPDALLLEQHATDITRQHCLLQTAGGTLIEIALDTGHAMAGAQSVPIIELELEHKGGPVQGLFELADSWVRHGGLWQSTITKAERGQRLLLPRAQSPEPKPRRPQLAASADGPALLRALLQATLAQVLAAASEVAEGDTAADTIHQLRVALRRLRTVLRELSALSSGIVPAWDAALADSFGQLGQTRDQQAVAAAVQPLLQAAGAPRLQWAAPVAVAPASIVREPAFQTTLIAILALAHAGDESFAPLSAQQVMALLSARLHKLHGQVAREGRQFERLPVPQQHRVRKRLKRLRYLIDLTAGLWPERSARHDIKRYLRRLSTAQAALGLHNDVAVAAEAFRQDAATHPEAWFAAGWLQAHQAVTARKARQALVKVAAGGKFWA